LFLAAAFFKICFFLASILQIHYLLIVKIIFALTLLGIYRELQYLLLELFRANKQECQFVALLCISIPSLYVFMASQVVIHLVCFWFLFIGHRFFRHQGFFNLSVGLFFLLLSFQVASCMIFVLALEAVYGYETRNWKRLYFGAVLLLMSIAYLFTLKIVSPPQQLHANYNQFLNIFSLVGILRLFKSIAMYMTWWILPVSAFMGSLLICYIAKYPRIKSNHIHALGNNFHHLMIAAFLCLAAVFPYLAVGKAAALFTVTRFGEGITEKTLRAVYTGLFAPTWSNTSGRQAVLYAMPLALVTWYMAKGVFLHHGYILKKYSYRYLFLSLFIMQMIWVGPGYMNKLDTQFSEISLRKALATLPAAPPGVVDLRYQPASDWLFWSSASNLLLREAWGRSDYYSMFHQTDDVRNDLMWQYHAFFLAQDGLNSAKIQHSMAMDGFPGVACWSRYEAVLPPAGWLALLAGGWFPGWVPAAHVRQLDADCQADRRMPNPTPWKINIP